MLIYYIFEKSQVLVFWVSPWACSIFARFFLPSIVRNIIGIFSRSAQKYWQITSTLELPLALLGWSFFTFIAFGELMYNHGSHSTSVNWRPWVHKILAALVVSCAVFLAKSVLVQIIFMRYKQTQQAKKITQNKDAITLLTELYLKSRQLSSDGSHKFSKDDELLTDTVTVSELAYLANNPDNVAILHSDTNKRVVHVLNHYKNRKFVTALARRIWHAFVPTGHEALHPSDLQPIFAESGPADIIDRCFNTLDKDSNGDITLNEMITQLIDIGRTREDLYSGYTQSRDIVAAFNVLCNFIVIAISILIFFGFLTSIGTTFGYVSGILASLGFAFNGTITEMFSAIIFIFVKHPFDVGDRVNLDGSDYIVKHISLLYTQVISVANSTYTHFPNSVLNGKKVENISRSPEMQEGFSLPVSTDTSTDDIDTLREELTKFIQANNRDFFTNADIVEVVDFSLSQLVIKVTVKYKGNWADGKRIARRAMVLLELARLTKLIPINGSGGGGAALGSSNNPSYRVAISADVAEEKVEKWKLAQEEARYNKKTV